MYPDVYSGTAGKQWVYVPDATAEHHVPITRASLYHFLRRTYYEGYGKIEMTHLLGRQEKLQDERDYLRRTLPAGILAGFKTAVIKRDPNALRKVGAIIAGVIAAGAGAVIAKSGAVLG